MGEKLLLWVFHAVNDTRGVIHHCYARTEIEARQKESAWMAEQVNAGLDTITVQHYPGGFMPGISTRWAGSIDASEVGHATTE